MQEKDPNVAYQYVLQSHPRGNQEKISILHSCNRPSRSATIDMYTNVMLCICDGWLPKPVGMITDFQKLEDIWNNDLSRIIQQDVENKKFTWCAVNHCGIKYQSHTETDYQLIFGIDDSCNLRCPSCRRETRMHVSGPLFEQKLQAVKHTIKLLDNFEPRIHITLASSGDPLASHIYRPLLQTYVGRHTQTFTLFTNGLLIKKQLDKTALFDRITWFRISVDAGSEEVYNKVRGGQWETLIENFDFLSEKNLSSKVELIFVVQRNNYRDIQNFVDLVNKYGFVGVLTQLDDWGTWNYNKVDTPDAWTMVNGTYLENNVLHESHPEHQYCKEIVESMLSVPRITVTPRIKQLLAL